LARAVLRSVDKEIEEAEIVDEGYVEFEFIGEQQYLMEGAFQRGAMRTSVDAFMIGRTARGCRPSIRPLSSSPWWKAASRCANGPGETPLRKPIAGIAGCCARTISGHAAMPPSAAMNVRRFIP
jgi:hypothetical protein